ncbi:MAG: F0F1 ATP synthase subunit B [Mariprofundaceae bacterium]
MPQFDPSFFPSEIIWTLVAFGLLFVLLKRLVLPKIIAALDERTEQMRVEMEQAQLLREKAEHLHADYENRLAHAEEDARKMFEASEKEAREYRNKLMGEWRAEMDRRKRQFREDVEVSKNRAMHDIREQSADLIVEATEKIIQQRVDKKQAQEAVDQLLEELRQNDKRGKPG